MNPELALARLRELARECFRDGTLSEADTQEMAEVFTELDEALSRGAQYPLAWRAGQWLRGDDLWGNRRLAGRTITDLPDLDGYDPGG